MRDRPGTILSVSGRFGDLSFALTISTITEATDFLHIALDTPIVAPSFDT